MYFTTSLLNRITEQSVAKITKKGSKTATVKGLKACKDYIKEKTGKESKIIKITVKKPTEKPAKKPTATNGSVVKGETKDGLMTLKIDLSFSCCGCGKVEMVLTKTKGGKCTDLNFTYVALCRSIE